MSDDAPSLAPVLLVSMPQMVDPNFSRSVILLAPAGSEVYNPGGESAPDACDLAPKGTDRIVPPWVG